VGSAQAAPAPARALVFVGFMGSGKSSAARAVAQALGVRALDSDELLEERAGAPIADIFAREGEADFRRQEEELVLELLAGARSGAVIALGGGSVLSPRVREALAPHLVVLLEVSARTAWERVGDHEGQRPLAREREQFFALHAEREPIYEELADTFLPVAESARAVNALPALAALACAPMGTRLVWAAASSAEYPVLIGRGLLRAREAGEGDGGSADGTGAGSAAALEGLWPLDRARSRPFCVSDDTVAALYAERLGELAALVTVAPGEEQKTLASAELVWRALARAGMSRVDHLVALGGGVVGDLAGFCAATYQRGVPIVHVPTTLVAQVDSAYGGKTGVDLPEAKNYVGAYHQPAAVIADPDTLETLPERELHAGWVEVLKTALIAGGELWRAVADGEPVSERVILGCARTKLAIVAADERDRGPRQLLNLGHTIGHAIETATGYGRYRHGEAVGLGLLAALELSGQGQLRGEVTALFEQRGLPVTLTGASSRDVLEAVSYDKKRGSGAGADGAEGRVGMPPFVLVDGPGAVRVGCPVGEADVRGAIEGLMGQ
jgi:shikimate kinase/3-dehydroquinate synthase